MDHRLKAKTTVTTDFRPWTLDYRLLINKS